MNLIASVVLAVVLSLVAGSASAAKCNRDNGFKDHMDEMSITQQDGTERPFQSEYLDNKETRQRSGR